jgi:hypothetical protein
LETAASAGLWVMSLPTLGELRFAQDLFASERKPYRRRGFEGVWNKFFDMAVMVTFVFFLFM